MNQENRMELKKAQRLLRQCVSSRVITSEAVQYVRKLDSSAGEDEDKILREREKVGFESSLLELQPYINADQSCRESCSYWLSIQKVIRDLATEEDDLSSVEVLDLLTLERVMRLYKRDDISVDIKLYKFTCIRQVIRAYSILSKRTEEHTRIIDYIDLNRSVLQTKKNRTRWMENGGPPMEIRLAQIAWSYCASMNAPDDVLTGSSQQYDVKAKPMTVVDDENKPPPVTVDKSQRRSSTSSSSESNVIGLPPGKGKYQLSEDICQQLRHNALKRTKIIDGKIIPIHIWKDIASFFDEINESWYLLYHRCVWKNTMSPGLIRGLVLRYMAANEAKNYLLTLSLKNINELYKSTYRTAFKVAAALTPTDVMANPGVSKIYEEIAAEGRINAKMCNRK